MNVFLRGTVLRKVQMTFSSHLACIKNKALQLKDQVQLTKLLIIRKDVARPSAQLAVVLLLNIQWVLLK